MLDLCITNGTVIDGTGAAGYPGSIGIKDGRIVAVGKLDDSASKETIDARGQVIAPGFVDIHTHYDAQLLWDKTLSPSSYHGVTTVVAGNCGFSIAPLSGDPADADYLMRMLARVEGMPLQSLQALPWDWKTTAEYLARVEGKVAINVGFMVGHSAMRRTVMGPRAIGEKATEEDIAEMQALLREGLAAGGLGFSTTTSPNHSDADGNPVPSRHASDQELFQLASVVGEFEGTTLEMVPNVSKEFDETQLQRLTNMSLAAGRPLNWNSLIPNSLVPQFHESHLAASDYAAARGAKIVPLVAAQVNTVWVNFITGFVLDSFPGWAHLMWLPLGARRQALADPEVRLQMDEGARSPAAGRRARSANWADWSFAEIFHPDHKRFQGMKIGDVATAMGKNPFDAMLDVVVADELKTSLQMPFMGADEESWRIREALWRDERTIVGASDAGAHLDMIDSFASAMKVLSDGVRVRGLLSIEEAVRQLTSVPARLYGLRERGELKVGNWADVVVFDPKTVGHGPIHMRYDMPENAGRIYAEATGVSHVIVNGCEIIRDRNFTGIYPGKVLHSGRDTYTVSIPAALNDAPSREGH